MYFWLKFLHIAAMAIWFAGLFFLPRVLIAHAQARDDGRDLQTTGRRLYFGLMTPAAVITTLIGTLLIFQAPHGAWLAAKLTLVALVVLLHVYFGKLLLDSCLGRASHGVLFYRVLNWIPLPLLLGIAALTAAKPAVLPPLDGG